MPKEIRYLSKRRVNQLIKRDIDNRYFDSIHSNKSNIVPNENAEAVFIPSHFDDISCASSTLSDITNYSDEPIPMQLTTINNEKHNIALRDNMSGLTDILFCNNENDLWKDLQTLIIEDNIPHNTANKLLKILKNHGHIELPNDVRVLVHTLRNASVNIIPVGNGHYVYFSLSSSLERSIKMYSIFIKSNDIRLNINIDGLSISKSSGSQLWPIMASIEGIDINTLPFIIGIYHGMCKPADANEFMNHFVNEFILLSQYGITISNVKYTVAINAILCDAPARSFITYTKGHTGYFSCPKCTLEGDFVRNKVIFPQTHNSLRTNETFKNRLQIEYHTGDSILEKLSIGMISQIPLDYMHLVCLGVMKRLLQLWLRGNKNIRLSANDVNAVSQHLLEIKTYIPSEFARKPRHLRDVDRWKATEFRQFLLYTGIVVMEPVLSSICYSHFVCLSVAIRMLTDSQLCYKANAYANSLLLWFVTNFGNVYGDEYLSYNVHNLIHLANDVQNFGSLDNFSCFKFENHMQKIKKKIKNSGKPLQELANRISEELQIPIQPCNMVQYPISVYSKNNKICYIQFQNFKISKKEQDNCAVLYNNDIVFVSNIFENNSNLFIRAKRFSNRKCLFDTPCASEKIGIIVILNTFDIVEIPVAQIKNKCLKIYLINENSYVILPLLHTNN